MNVLILAVGRLKRAPEAELCADYLNRASRMGRSLGIARTEIREIAESRSERAADRLAQEADAIEAAIPAGFQRICLDENGKLLDSREFAELMRGKLDQSVPGIAILIGGPDGLDPRLVSECDLSLSFGRLTWPHRLVRVMITEQIYRVMTLLAGHPYHRQ